MTTHQHVHRDFAERLEADIRVRCRDLADRMHVASGDALCEREDREQVVDDELRDLFAAVDGEPAAVLANERDDVIDIEKTIGRTNFDVAAKIQICHDTPHSPTVGKFQRKEPPEDPVFSVGVFIENRIFATEDNIRF